MHIIENTGRYLCAIFKGSVEQEQLFLALKEIFMHPDYPHKNSMWIFEGCECDFSSISMMDMLQMIKTFYPREATRKKTAIVTSTATHHAMAKIFCEDAGNEAFMFTLRAFMDRSEAEAWLMEK
jgi:hypothetical protein